MLLHIKMHSGDDLLANLVSNNPNGITIKNPIKITLDPVEGFFAQSWMLLSKENSVYLSNTDILFSLEANDKAVEYYISFESKLKDIREQSDAKETRETSRDKYDSDAMIDYLEAKISTKH